MGIGCRGLTTEVGLALLVHGWPPFRGETIPPCTGYQVPGTRWVRRSQPTGEGQQIEVVVELRDSDRNCCGAASADHFDLRRCAGCPAVLDVRGPGRGDAVGVGQVLREVDPVCLALFVGGAFAGIFTGQVLRDIPLRAPRLTCGVLAGGSTIVTLGEL